MTNKEWLGTLSDEKFYDVWYKAFQTIGMSDINTRLRMIDWLGEEHIIDVSDDAYKRALSAELAWQEKEADICNDLIQKIDNGEKVGWTRETLLTRYDCASRAVGRIMQFLADTEKEEL